LFSYDITNSHLYLPIWSTSSGVSINSKVALSSLIRIESSSITFDIANSNLTDVNNGVATVKLDRADDLNGITYEAGESIVVLGYSTVSSTERYDVLYSLVLNEALVNLLEIDDYEFNVSGIGVDNVLITKVNVSNTVKLGIGVNVNQQTTGTEEKGGNSTVGIIAIIGLVVVAGGAFMLLKKKKNKN
jgi:LPXTG-motif cell wall-anchored protein